jgi:hypothetical protein
MRKLIAILVAGATGAGVYAFAPSSSEPAGHLYVMRGLFGGFPFKFSTGVDAVADKAAKAYNLEKTVKSWRSSSDLCRLATEQYRKDRKPIFVVGHSKGADEIPDFAACLKREGIPVSFAFFYDPTPLVSCVPDNVKFTTNWRRSFVFDLGGGYIKRCSGSTKDIANITVQTRHTVLDDLPSVHAATLKRIGIVMEAK